MLRADEKLKEEGGQADQQPKSPPKTSRQLLEVNTLQRLRSEDVGDQGETYEWPIHVKTNTGKQQKQQSHTKQKPTRQGQFIVFIKGSARACASQHASRKSQWISQEFSCLASCNQAGNMTQETKKRQGGNQGSPHPRAQRSPSRITRLITNAKDLALSLILCLLLGCCCFALFWFFL